MAFDYSRARATAERQIRHFGQSAVLKRYPAPTGHNPGASIPTDYPCQIVVTNYSQYHVDGSRVQAGDRKVLISTQGLAIEPQPGDRLLIGIHQYSIVNVDPLAPGGVNVMFTAQCRR